MSASCSECDGPLKTQKYVHCNGICGTLYHLKCVKLSEYDLNLINEKERLLYMCKKCREYVNLMLNKVSEIAIMISEQNKQIEKQNVNIVKILDGVKHLSEEK